MSTRDRLLPAVTSGGATAVKLLVATLAFTAAYAGVGAAHAPGDRGAAGAAGSTSTGASLKVTAESTTSTTESTTNVSAGTVGTAPVRLTPLSVRSVPIAVEARPKPGTVTVSAVAVRTGASDVACRRAYQAQSLVVAADGVTIYHWRLQRWSDASNRWRPYMSAPAGFVDDTRTVRWRPQIVANPGWYRVEIKVQPGGTHLSEGFRVTC